MRIQLWSYNYDPEPTGIGPVSRSWAEAMRDRGHEIHVVAAHPHYPEPRWDTCRLPYTEEREAIQVTRLPLWIGRDTTWQRMRQDASFAIWQAAYLPLLGGADAVVAVSPCFPALAPAILNHGLRRTPLILWIQDILPDGALATGIVKDGIAVTLSRKLEAAAYSAADKIVVISDHFRQNLIEKGVPEKKVVRIYNPATRPVRQAPRSRNHGEPPRVLAMGNIGLSQGLPDVVRAFESSDELAKLDARLIITGTGVAEDEVRAAISTSRVEMLGVVSEERLDHELKRATIGLVSQRSDFPEFNMPSKLMNYMAEGLPVIAAVGSASEVARVVETNEAGLVCSNDGTEQLGAAVSRMLHAPEQLARMSERSRLFASTNLDPKNFAEQFELRANLCE